LVIVADAADGADGVMGSVLTQGRYPDCSRSQPPLAAEDNLNPERAEEGLCPAQPTSECAWALWPASPVGADLQKVGCVSGPLRSVGHDFAHTGRDRVGVDDVLDRAAAVVRISGLKAARGAKGAREVSQARQPLEAHLRQHVQAMRGRIEKGAKDVRWRELELPPKRHDRCVGGGASTSTAFVIGLVLVIVLGLNFWHG
jgi:hypothetical protein